MKKFVDKDKSIGKACYKNVSSRMEELKLKSKQERKCKLEARIKLQERPYLSVKFNKFSIDIYLQVDLHTKKIPYLGIGT